ncbi:TPA: hypothetical protein OV554_003654, partial [Acinetobacter baumannii]|nr:hypothetical protein [Acinetobacter baumannii]
DQLINAQPKANGRTATIGTKLARQIERSLSLVNGYMDSMHPEQEKILDQLKVVEAQDKRQRDVVIRHRRDNLMYLIELKKLDQAKFARKVGCSTTLLNLIIDEQEKPNGGIAVVNDLLAHQIEKAFDLDTGYMDIKHLENYRLIQRYKTGLIKKGIRPKLARVEATPANKEKIASIRKDNLLYLIETHTETAEGFSALIGSSWNYLRSIINSKIRPDGHPYALGRHLARQIERALSLPDGYMDIEHEGHANFNASRSIFLSSNRKGNRNQIENTNDPLYAVRRVNLNFLVTTKVESQKDFAQLIGVANSHLSQIRTNYIGLSGRTVVLSDNLAGKIERVFGLDTGYMDIEQDYIHLLKSEQGKTGNINDQLNTALLELLEAQKTEMDKNIIISYLMGHQLEIATNEIDGLEKSKT